MKICVFCSSKSDFPVSTFEQADLFCEKLVDADMSLVYGGGKVGMMGHIADQVLRHNGEVIGVMPTGLFPNEVAHEGLTELLYTEDLMARKRKMMDLSDAFVVFPGGIGTMDEALEVITWKSIQGFAKPIVIFNWQGFWDPFLSMLKSYEDKKVFYPGTMETFDVVSDVEQMIQGLTK